MTKEKNKTNTIMHFVKYYKPYKGLFFFDLSCALLMAVCNLVYPGIAKNIINVYAPNGQILSIILWSEIMLAIFLLKAFLTYSVNYWGHLLGVKIQRDMRQELFTHLEKLPFSYYDETKVGSIMSRLINDLFEISEFAHHGPEDLFISLITIIGALILIIPINIWLSLIVFAVMPVMFIIVILIRKRMRRVINKTRETNAQLNAEVESSLSGIRVSKSYAAEHHEIEKFKKTNDAYVHSRKNHYMVLGEFHTALGFCNDFLYLITLAAGGIFFALGKIDAGGMAAYILYISMLISPIRTFVTLFEQIEMGFSGFERFREIMQISPEDFQTGNPIQTKIEGNIKFEHVSFSYNKQSSHESKEKLVIQDVSIDIPKGHTVALVGPSGGGKSTLCNLIPRFYEINDGKITLDGTDIRDYLLTDLRKNIGVVQQDVFLYGGTIKENIAYGNFDATDEDIVNAAKLAGIDDYINTLDKGYDTYVGERGVKLSGGQKQRISIARAFLKNPPVLILDEATSALDNATEMLIQQSLDKLSNGRTTIVVAHRLSTIKKADEIIVITADGVAERGTHEQLLQKHGVYRELYDYQFKNV